VDASPSLGDSYLLDGTLHLVQKVAALISEHAWLEYRLGSPIGKNAQFLCA